MIYGGRYSVERCQRDHPSGRNYGYIVRDLKPNMQRYEDIEGVGYVKITPRPILWVGWARIKQDAIAIAKKKAREDYNYAACLVCHGGG